jgi:hypothetical protein
MPNYVKSAATAKRLIDGAGRDFTLVALDFDAPDPLKPWRGPRDPRATPASSLTLRGAVLPLSSLATLGFRKTTFDLSKKADLTVLLGSTLDLSIYQECVDSSDGRRYKILLVDELKPATLRILSYLVLQQ